MPAVSLASVRGRGKVLSFLERELILTRVRVFGDGHFLEETKEWASYWNSLRELGHSETNKDLDELHSAWRNYIHSGFDSTLQREFCFRYFVLLDDILVSFQKAVGSHPWDDALKATLGFECFSIISASESEAVAAGTCTLRNPCYLLAKLRMPDVLDDPQFLPIITVACIARPELFYHYRQYTLSLDSQISLMLYPAVSMTKRPGSFRLVNSFAGGVGYSIDPRTHERAQRLFQHIIRPVIEDNRVTEQGTACVELVDVGAGTGSLTSTICREIQRAAGSENSCPQFRLWFVDLEPSDPARFFRARRVRGLVES